MSASSGITPPSRETLLREILAAEAAQKPYSRPSTQFLEQLQAHKNFLKKVNLYSVIETPPAQEKHTDRVRQRTSYKPPSRRGRIVVSVQLDPSTKNDLDNAVAQSGLNQQEFLSALIKHTVQTRSPETKETTKHAPTKARESDSGFHR